MRDEIRKDVHRTHAGMHFFAQPIAYEKYAPSEFLDDDGHLRDPIRQEGEHHSDVLQRILVVYATLNPGVKYVQGMNELLAPLYFVSWIE